MCECSFNYNMHTPCMLLVAISRETILETQRSQYNISYYNWNKSIGASRPILIYLDSIFFNLVEPDVISMVTIGDMSHTFSSEVRLTSFTVSSSFWCKMDWIIYA